MAKKGEVLLTVTSQDGLTDIVLDLYENISIPTTYQFSNVQDFSKTNSNHSQNFRIPGTPKNNDFFGSQYNVNISGTFNPKKKATAVLSYDTLPQIVGYIQLKNVIVQKGRFVEYEVVLFGDVANFGAEVGDKKLEDYTTFLATLDHNFTAANVRLSWANNLLGGDVVYPLIDWGANYYGGDGLSGSGQNITEVIDGSNLSQWKPAIKLKAILDGIFAEEGFTYTSDFFSNNTDFAKLIIPCPGAKGENFAQGGALANEFTTQMVTSQPAGTTVTLSVATNLRTPLNIFGVALADGGFDNGSDFGTATDAAGFSYNYYLATYSGDYSMTYRLKFINDVASFSDTYFSIEVCPNTNFALADTLVYNGFPVQQLAAFTTIASNNSTLIPLNNGDYVRLVVRHYEPSAVLYTFSTDVLDANSIQSSASYFNVRPSQDFLTGNAVDFTQCMPDLKAIDLFNSITKMFNLIIIPDPENETNLLIEPYETWIAGGDIVDWTDKLDISKDIQITPTTELQTENLLFTYKQGEDILSKLTKENSDRVYGRKLIDQTNNDFAKGERKVELDFVATPSNLIPDTSIIIPKLVDKSGAPIEPKPRILVWHGLVPAGVQWYFHEQNLTGTPVISNEIFYAKASHYFQSELITLDGDDLNWGMETPYHYIQSAPEGTLYKKYWETFVDEIYSETAKLMKANFKITSADIFKFKFNDKIWIKDSYWRINKINGWTITDSKTVQVELLKLPNVKINCEWIPDSSTNNGTITMINDAGATGVGTEECCVFAGYNWVYVTALSAYRCRYLSNPGGGLGGEIVSTTNGLNFTYADPLSSTLPTKLISSGTPKSVNPLGENMVLAGKSQGEYNGKGNMILGIDNTLSSGSVYGQISGQGNTISEVDSLALNNPTATDISFASVQGINGEALHKGEWALGGGKKSGRSVAVERTGRANHGKLIYLCEGDTRDLKGEGVGNVYGIELFLQGDTGAKITFDELTAWIITNEVIMTFDSGVFTSLKPQSFIDNHMIWRDSDNATTGAKVYQGGTTGKIAYESSTVYYIHYHITQTGIQMFLIQDGAKKSDFITASCVQTYTQIKPYTA